MGQLGRGDLKSVVDGRVGSREQPRHDGKRRGTGEVVILPNVGRDHGDATSCVSRKFVCNLPCGLNARFPTVVIGLVAGLWIYDIFLCAIYGQEARCPSGALDDGSIEIPAETEVEREAGSDLPGVLQIQAEVIAIDGSRADMRDAGKIRRRHGHRVEEGAAGEKAGERIGEWIAGIEVV